MSVLLSMLLLLLHAGGGAARCSGRHTLRDKFALGSEGCKQVCGV
jgi:hypothetical protein